jgi:dienelactone hydrolase
LKCGQRDTEAQALRGQRRDRLCYREQSGQHRKEDAVCPNRRTVIGALLAGLIGARPARAFEVPALPRVINKDYARARADFRTHLTRMGPAPDTGDPLSPPPEGAARLAYRSGALDLSAWISLPAPGPPRRPAVLFLHGGNALGSGHWDLTQPYREAGYVAMVPALRAENGQPGAYSGFYDETSDVLAAVQALQSYAGVDRNRIFLAGHSIGATQALLAALSTTMFRGAASFSGNPNAYAFFKRFPEELCFDTGNPLEFEMRSAACFAGSFKCPTRIYHGTKEAGLVAPSDLTIRRARAAGLDVAGQMVPGDHFSALPAEIAASLAFFATL